jgi:hypothetical protein
MPPLSATISRIVGAPDFGNVTQLLFGEKGGSED